jgi:hypothetical protein
MAMNRRNATLYKITQLQRQKQPKQQREINREIKHTMRTILTKMLGKVVYDSDIHFVLSLVLPAVQQQPCFMTSGLFFSKPVSVCDVVDMLLALTSRLSHVGTNDQ